MTHIN